MPSLSSQVDQTVQSYVPSSGGSSQVSMSTNVGLAPRNVPSEASNPAFHQEYFYGTSSPKFNATYANAYRNYKLVWTPGYLVRERTHLRGHLGVGLSGWICRWPVAPGLVPGPERRVFCPWLLRLFPPGVHPCSRPPAPPRASADRRSCSWLTTLCTATAATPRGGP